MLKLLLISYGANLPCTDSNGGVNHYEGSMVMDVISSIVKKEGGINRD